MSLHYPHRVGTVAAMEAGRRRVPSLVHRYPRASDSRMPGMTEFMRTGRQRTSDLRLKQREGAALLGGILVLLITAWLVWGALAEAALARASGL